MLTQRYPQEIFKTQCLSNLEQRVLKQKLVVGKLRVPRSPRPHETDVRQSRVKTKADGWLTTQTSKHLQEKHGIEEKEMHLDAALTLCPSQGWLYRT